MHEPETTPAVPAGAVGAPDDWPAISAGNLARFWEHSARAMAQRQVRWDDAWAADAASLSPYPNSATLTRPLDAAGASDLAARLTAFYAAGPGGAWLLWSAWRSPDLTNYGFVLGGHPPQMVRPAGGEWPSRPADLRIVEARDATTLAAFNTVLINGYPAPELQAAGIGSFYDARALGGPLRLWVGFVGDEPVTCVAAYVGERAVGIYAVATLAHARGKGFGGAITARAAQAAPALPAELQASDDGRPVYLRLGFRVVAPYTLWVHPRA